AEGRRQGAAERARFARACLVESPEASIDSVVPAMHRPRPLTHVPGLAPVLLLVGSLAHAGAAAAGEPGSGPGSPPTVTIRPDTMRADELGSWRANLVIENKAGVGLYADSLSYEWKSDDPDSSASPHAGSVALTGLIALIAPASAGESTGMQWSSSAQFIRGT